MLQEGIKKFPGFHKLYLMLGQLEERQGRAEAARAAYLDGLKRCMDSVPLWRSIARLEEAGGSVAKARALLEQVHLALSSSHWQGCHASLETPCIPLYKRVNTWQDRKGALK